MTIEQRPTFLRIPIPFTKRELPRDTSKTLEKCFDDVAKRLTVITPDKVSITSYWLDDGSVEKQIFLEGEDINLMRIRSKNGILFGNIYRWRPAK